MLSDEVRQSKNKQKVVRELLDWVTGRKSKSGSGSSKLIGNTVASGTSFSCDTTQVASQECEVDSTSGSASSAAVTLELDSSPSLSGGNSASLTDLVLTRDAGQAKIALVRALERCGLPSDYFEEALRITGSQFLLEDKNCRSLAEVAELISKYAAISEDFGVTWWVGAIDEVEEFRKYLLLVSNLGSDPLYPPRLTFTFAATFGKSGSAKWALTDKSLADKHLLFIPIPSYIGDLLHIPRPAYRF